VGAKYRNPDPIGARQINFRWICHAAALNRLSDPASANLDGETLQNPGKESHAIFASVSDAWHEWLLFECFG
jgi:hypothetical protein